MKNNKFLGLTYGLGFSQNRKYYVYRLVDPRTLQTFYVGKGCDDRAYQHVNNVKSLIGKNKDDDIDSLKSKQIADILAAGKGVIIIFHRRGLTEREAFEVEGALIDCYPGLTNVQDGHSNAQRGLISAEDLIALQNAVDYTEPNDDYIIIKTTSRAVQDHGSLYEATRRAWRADLKKAKRYKYVLAVINGIVREVYEVDRWYVFNPSVNNRIAFDGKETKDPISSLKGKRIPPEYRKKGQANPFMYKKK